MLPRDRPLNYMFSLLHSTRCLFFWFSLGLGVLYFVQDRFLLLVAIDVFCFCVLFSDKKTLIPFLSGNDRGGGNRLLLVLSHAGAGMLFYG
jgi:hypothetical protein